MNEERLYTIPLRKDWLKKSRNKRTNRAVSTIRKFLTRHMKTEQVNLSQALNETLWVRGLEKPPGKIRIKAVKEEEIVTAMLPDETPKKKEAKKGLKEKILGKGDKAELTEEERKILEEAKAGASVKEQEAGEEPDLKEEKKGKTGTKEAEEFSEEEKKIIEEAKKEAEKSTLSKRVEPQKEKGKTEKASSKKKK